MADLIKAYNQGRDDAVKADPGQQRMDAQGPSPSLKSKTDEIGAYNQGRHDGATALIGRINSQDTPAPKTANDHKVVGK